jgi:serine protease Do
MFARKQLTSQHKIKAASAIAISALLFLSVTLAGCNAATSATKSTSTPTPTHTLSQNTTTTSSLPTITDVIAEVNPAVVSIVVGTVSYNFFMQPVPSSDAGSGIIIDSNGYIATNYHVIADATSITVTLTDGRSFNATVVGSDSDTDLAVIKIDGNNLPTASFGKSSTLKVGDWVIAIGNALALEGGSTATVGIVSAVNRTVEESSGTTLYGLIQTDAAINPGNSGGPLIDLSGEVIGINTAKVSSQDVDGIGFAISSDSAKPIIDELIAQGYVSRPYLGVSLSTVTSSVAAWYELDTDTGALIMQIDSTGPAAKAGLKTGDVITAIDGQAINTADDAIQAIHSHNIGDTIQISYYRGNILQSASVKLAENPH